MDVPLLLEYLGRLLDERGHAVVCVAEGAGQELLFAGERLAKARARARGLGGRALSALPV